MRIYLREISEVERNYEYTQKESWLLSSLEKADEITFQKEWPNKTREVKLSLKTLKTDRIYWLTGKLSAELGLICSRCGEPFLYKCQPPFQHLYSQDESLTGGGDAHTQGRDAYQKNNNPESITELDQHSDHGVNFLDEDFVELDPIVTEHFNIAIPFQPKCDIHGGLNCNIPLLPENVEIAVKSSPFSVLKNLKVSKH